jgi:hypothetical protein
MAEVIRRLRRGPAEHQQPTKTGTPSPDHRSTDETVLRNDDDDGATGTTKTGNAFSGSVSGSGVLREPSRVGTRVRDESRCDLGPGNNDNNVKRVRFLFYTFHRKSNFFSRNGQRNGKHF